MVGPNLQLKAEASESLLQVLAGVALKDNSLTHLMHWHNRRPLQFWTINLVFEDSFKRGQGLHLRLICTEDNTQEKDCILIGQCLT